MKSVPDVSVIIPFYNREKYLARCVRSILSQTFSRKRYEIILVDDGSTDNSLEALIPFLDDIILIRNDLNKGLPYSLNRAIKKASGQFILRLDSDDFVSSRFIDFLSYYLLKNTNVHAVACDYYLVDDDENIIERKNSSSYPIGCGILFRKDSLVSVGLYDSSKRIDEDKDLMQRFKECCTVDRLAIPLYKYRMHDANMTGDRALAN